MKNKTLQMSSQTTNEPKTGYGLDNDFPSENDPVFMDLCTCYGWKWIMGDEDCRRQLASLINALVEEKTKVTKIKHDAQQEYDEEVNDENALYAIHCQDQKGRKYSLEMATEVNESTITDMLFYYAAELDREYLTGRLSDTPYNLTGIIFTNLAIAKAQPDAYIHTSKFKVFRNHTSLNVKIGIITIELSKFDKNVDELETLLDQWLYIIKNMGSLKEIPEVLDTDMFRPVFDRARLAD